MYFYYIVYRILFQKKGIKIWGHQTNYFLRGPNLTRPHKFHAKS